MMRRKMNRKKMTMMNWMNQIRFQMSSKNPMNDFLTYVLRGRYFSHYLTTLRPVNGGDHRDDRGTHDHIHHIHHSRPRGQTRRT